MSDFVRVIAAWILVHCMSASLAVWGFERTLSLILHPKMTRHGAMAERHDELVDRVARSVERAKRWHVRVRTEDCLPVALAGTCMLRRLGVKADLMLGVTRYPFAAHAWVAAGKRVIDFPPNKYKKFHAVNMSAPMVGRPKC